MKGDCRCMVVDDDADMRALVCLVLEMAGSDLIVACVVESGDEAVATIDDCDPGVVVIDEMMPGLGGLEAVERIRVHRPHQRFVLFSAFLEPELRRRAKVHAVHICLSKQDIDVLPDAVRLAALN